MLSKSNISFNYFIHALIYYDTLLVAVGRINEIILNGMKAKGSRFAPITRPMVPLQRPMLNQPPPLMSLETQPPQIPTGVSWNYQTSFKLGALLIQAPLLPFKLFRSMICLNL